MMIVRGKDFAMCEALSEIRVNIYWLSITFFLEDRPLTSNFFLEDSVLASTFVSGRSGAHFHFFPDLTTEQAEAYSFPRSNACSSCFTRSVSSFSSSRMRGKRLT